MASRSRPPRHAAARVRRRDSWTADVLSIAAPAVVFLLLYAFIARPFLVPSASMEPALQVGDRVLTSLLHGPGDLRRGDIVVFADPGGWLEPEDGGEHLVKRLIGLPGDTVTCCDDSGRISVNGAPIEEPYVIEGAAPSTIPGTWAVPSGSVFVLGDNRPVSADSRLHPETPGAGMVPVTDVVGVAFAVYWPPTRWQAVHAPAETFERVPPPGR